MRGAEARGAALAGLTAFALAWVSGLLYAPPVPLLDVRTGAWRLGRVPTPDEIVYFGRLLLAWGAALPAGALGALAAARGWQCGPLWALWAATALAGAVLLSIVAFWP